MNPPRRQRRHSEPASFSNYTPENTPVDAINIPIEACDAGEETFTPYSPSTATSELFDGVYSDISESESIPTSCTSNGVQTSCPGSPVAESSLQAQLYATEEPTYRKLVLGQNKIYMIWVMETHPDLSTAPHDLSRGRSSPEPDAQSLEQSIEYQDMLDGIPTCLLRTYVRLFMLCLWPVDGRLWWTTDACIHRDWVPYKSNPSNLCISQPRPNALYGYHCRRAFSPKHRIALMHLLRSMAATMSGLTLPFLTIEYCNVGPGVSDNIWAAENRCMGAASTCVNMVCYLNLMLRSVDLPPVEQSAYSVIISNQHATIFVTQLGEKAFYTTRVKSFTLSDPEQLIDLRKHVRNILDWGLNERLDAIYDRLTRIYEKIGKPYPVYVET